MRVWRMGSAVATAASIALLAGCVGAAFAVPSPLRGSPAVASPKGYTIVNGPLGTLPGDSGSFTATCPKGTIAIGGGEENTSGNTDVYLSGSYPSGRKWVSVLAQNDAPTVPSVESLVICIAQPAGFKAVTKTVSAAAVTDTTASVSCPAGDMPLGGGTKPAQAVFETIAGSRPSGSSWQVTVMNESSGALAVTLDAVCATKLPNYRVFTASATAAAGDVSQGIAECGKGVILSGGEVLHATGITGAVNYGFPSEIVETGHAPIPAWVAGMNNPAATAETATIYAVCAT